MSRFTLFCCIVIVFILTLYHIHHHANITKDVVVRRHKRDEHPLPALRDPGVTLPAISRTLDHPEASPVVIGDDRDPELGNGVSSRNKDPGRNDSVIRHNRDLDSKYVTNRNHEPNDVISKNMDHEPSDVISNNMDHEPSDVISKNMDHNSQMNENDYTSVHEVVNIKHDEPSSDSVSMYYNNHYVNSKPGNTAQSNIKGKDIPTYTQSSSHRNTTETSYIKGIEYDYKSALTRQIHNATSVSSIPSIIGNSVQCRRCKIWSKYIATHVAPITHQNLIICTRTTTFMKHW